MATAQGVEKTMVNATRNEHIFCSPDMMHETGGYLHLQPGFYRE